VKPYNDETQYMGYMIHSAISRQKQDIL